MSAEPIFSPRLLIGWVAAAIALFAVSLYFMGGGELGGPDSVGPSTFSRSAIGYEGIAEVLEQLGIPVLKSRSSSLEKLSDGGVLIIAEPGASAQVQDAARALLKASTVLLVLPKWSGPPSEQKPGWLREVSPRSVVDPQRVLNLVGAKGDVVREDGDVSWTTNPFKTTPTLDKPLQLIRGSSLHPIVAAEQGMLVGESYDARQKRRIWVVADPDVMSNHGLAHDGNATFAVAMIRQLRGEKGNVVFDETVHGFVVRTGSPLLLLFRFPFIVATVQGLIVVALLLWATLARFGAPQAMPPALSAGREGLLTNIAKLVEFTGHQDVMIRRYALETVREVARQLHAPRGLSAEALVAWLQRVGTARGVSLDCAALLQRLAELGEGGRRNLSALVRLARDFHQWKGEIVDGRSRHSHDH
jgi:hypothetical protein